MAGAEDREALAAELALGTLGAEERMQAERLVRSDPEFARLAAAWERRLAPLALALESAPAPGHLRQRVLDAVAAADQPSAKIIVLSRSVRRWRVASGLLAAVAAGLMALMLIRPPQPAPAGRFVAVLEAEGPGPAFLASVDLAKGTIAVRTLGAAPQTGKSYELWALGAGRTAPQSLGVISADFRIPAGNLGKVDKTVLGDTLFAVSLEPQGGSPTGQPTGPVLFTGKLVETE